MTEDNATPATGTDPRRVAARSAQDIIAATLASRVSYGGWNARWVAAHVLSDLVSADWLVIHRDNVASIAPHLKDGQV